LLIIMTTKFFRKNVFLLFWGGLMGLVALCWPAVLKAQNGVMVSGLTVDAGTVTFNMSWIDTGLPEVWSDTVWVFVDYNNAGKMERLLLTTGATLTETSASGIGCVEYATDNKKGVWVIGNARDAGSFSATVQLFTATATTDFPGVCVYASNYPPLGKWKEDGSGVSFTGTPNYEILLTHIQSGATSTVISGKDFVIPPEYVITSFTDATGAPGTFHCISPAAPSVAQGEFCYEQSGELRAVASGSVTIIWYDALTGGTLLHTGEVLSLTPLYNAAAQYYAQAVSVGNCRSARTKAEYSVKNCTISGDCPGYTAGNVGANTTPAACAAHYAGQIGASDGASAVCVAHDAGRIGKQH
jgi:hypothetical protein